MQDNALIALLITAMISGEQAAGISGTPIAQAFQPTQQGVNSAPTAYLYKIGDRRRGYPRRTDSYSAGVMTHTELQAYETTFQISALATQNPSTPTQMTASDILNSMAYVLQSQQTIATLEANGVGILHIGDVRNPPFSDDRQRWEFNPNFDITVTHFQVFTTTIPYITAEEFQILTV